jgi:hypothetical protein
MTAERLLKNIEMQAASQSIDPDTILLGSLAMREKIGRAHV